MLKKLLGTAAVATLLASPAAADIKIGFVTTLTTPVAVIGKDMRDAVELAMEHIGGKMSGEDVEIVYADDEFNSQKGKQATERLVLRDDVDIVAGYIWSNVLLASAPVVLNANKILISANAGPSPLAGAQCNANFFNIAWQNDQTPMALGELLNQQGVKSLYLVAPNYAAGQNMVAGVERTFKGKVVGKDMTVWPSQRDWSAELSKVKAAKPDGVFTFYPGPAGPAFIKQYQQAGLEGDVPLYSVYTLDSISLPLFQKAGMETVLGTKMTQFWAPDLDNAANKKFVGDFRKKYGRYPSFYAAQSYDSIMYIKSAVEAVSGDIGNIDGMRAALEKADFDSIRGDFTMGNNHFPIQNFYERTVVKDADGNWTTAVGRAVLTNHQDPYASQCKM
ncbi:MAG: ABC transporter substrate-binding protein [Rhodospirillaceae bacterium]|jgi:branched-chain amino acid transport system substrate-binding protein|nr:ABC transporter substrate-binding protein [Rhodospirillaceae bacterium]MBT3931312.1 ABC transporter substrate-binding protein [Rhodospirillaceae bacterium]MBT4772201.1 ABC transporter substrate-binding protein [Rhodospirillaceae bacterium]MBT5359488.1 ABC transporter substrate-binding protein [Rhodospirillaceae bacterium]MBT5768319.1 ABC transporter substrate-binding protein [Rhodospirillaceae bacterium]